MNGWLALWALVALDLVMGGETFLGPLAVVGLLASLALAVRSVQSPAATPTGRLMRGALWGHALVQVGLIPTRRPALGLVTGEVAFAVGLAAMAGLVGSYGWRRAPGAGSRPFALIALWTALAVGVIRARPLPDIDVWYFQTHASAWLLGGSDPYVQEYPNIYNHTAFYAPEVMHDGQLRGFPYPPLSLLLVLAGHVLGDVRYALAAALAVAAVVAVKAGRRLGLGAGHPAELLALGLLLHPRSLFVIEQSWTEPLLALAASLLMRALTSSSRPGRVAALAALVSVKQVGPLWLAVVGARRRCWRECVLALGLGALPVVPFVLWHPAALWRATVLFHVYQPFRMDSLSVTALIARWTGWRMPGVTSFVAATVVALLVARRSSRAGAVLVAGAAVQMAFFAFGKQAFTNYYWLVSCLLSLGLFACLADPTDRASEAQSPVT